MVFNKWKIDVNGMHKKMIKNKFVVWGKPNVWGKPKSKKVTETNDANLENRVKCLREERIKILQRELVEISVQHNGSKEISTILNEIKKLRASLKFTENPSTAFKVGAVR